MIYISHKIISKELSPIVLFVYDRLWHTRQTVESLKNNLLAPESNLFIYSDFSKNINDTNSVNFVRQYLKSIDGFKSIIIKERDKNWGLADNIIDGVTEIVNRYGKIIVLEDDLVTSPHFLTYMNDALEFYKDKKNVWHVSGWNYPIDPEGLPDVFFWRVMNCWGWATWKDRWKYFERKPEWLYKNFSKKEKWQFNLDGTHNFWDQVQGNFEGYLKTWAIYWYATIFKNKGFCLNPSQSLVQNIGLDGSGTYCSNTKNLQVKIASHPFNVFTKNIVESEIAINRIKEFFKLSKPSFICKVIGSIMRKFSK